jgi:hypothetical protein
MRSSFMKLFVVVMLCATVVMSFGCGGGGGSATAPAPAPTYTIGGTVSQAISPDLSF